MRYSIVNHWIEGEGVERLECTKNTRAIVGPDMIILHYTAREGVWDTANFLARADVAASAHLVIGRDGQVIQLVPFDVEAWHAGKSCYEGRCELNHYSIGVELDNLGQLRLEDDKFVSGCGIIVPFDQVWIDERKGRKTYWHKYTRVQERVLEEVCGLLVESYAIRDIVGHSDVAAGREEPGPALRLSDWVKYY